MVKRGEYSRAATKMKLFSSGARNKSVEVRELAGVYNELLKLFVRLCSCVIIRAFVYV